MILHLMIAQRAETSSGVQGRRMTESGRNYCVHIKHIEEENEMSRQQVAAWRSMARHGAEVKKLI
eukprot:scaffold10414_cov97-Skeletonema_dohrnii-CCMP3373.AAC.1